MALYATLPNRATPPDSHIPATAGMPCGEHAQSDAATAAYLHLCEQSWPAQRVLDMFSTGDTGRCLPSLVDVLQTEGMEPRPPVLGRNVFTGKALQALTDGGERSDASHIKWNVAGKGKLRCIAPRYMAMRAGEAARLGTNLELEVRCRKCDPCRKARSAFWKLRAMAEIAASPRTWFVTLTFTPDQQVKADYAARLRLDRGGVDEPTEADLFRERFRALAPEVTRWMKRVRKGLKGKGWETVSFRYLLVAEAHKSSLPHVHLLLHEQQGQTITKRRIELSWLAGFSSAKLVGAEDIDDPHKAAAYVCKYIAKSSLARVRASQGYGVNC